MKLFGGCDIFVLGKLTEESCLLFVCAQPLNGGDAAFCCTHMVGIYYNVLATEAYLMD